MLREALLVPESLVLLLSPTLRQSGEALRRVVQLYNALGRPVPARQESALSLVYKLEDVDRALLVQFNETIKGSAEFTGDISRLENFVQGLQAWGGTSLYDAIHYSLERIKDQPGRKAVVVFTDGADTTSTLKEQDVIDYARAVEATVYSIGFRGESGLFARNCASASRMPDVTSSLVGVFTAAATRPPSINTASVLVPPTSMPMRLMPQKRW